MKVLLVEDDVKIATAIQRGLTAEGFTVEVAFDGDDGLWRATEGAYDLYVLDLMLPGPQRLPDLRGAPRGGRLDADPRAHRQGRRARRGRGARHRRRRLPHQAVLVPGADRPRAGAAAADGRARSRAGRGRRPADRPGRSPGVARPTREIVLTAREFDVLEFLVRRAGQAMSKAEILAGVWDYDFDGDPNIVEVYIGRLRRKVDEPFGAAHHRDGPRRRLPPGGDVMARLTVRARITLLATAVVCRRARARRRRARRRSSAGCSPRRSTSRSSSGPTRSPRSGEDVPRDAHRARRRRRGRAGRRRDGRGGRVERQRRRRRAGRSPTDAGRGSATVDDLPHEDERLPRAGRPGRRADVVIVGCADSTTSTTASPRCVGSLARRRSRSSSPRSALVLWWLVGRTLRPVEAIRAEVAAIGGRDLDRRVPVPPADDEVGRLARTMNDMLERVDDAAQRQRRFVADASHELRSPLDPHPHRARGGPRPPRPGRPARDPRQRARRDDRAAAPRRRPAARRPRRRGRARRPSATSRSTSTTSCSASPAACAPTTACRSTSAGVGAGRVRRRSATSSPGSSATSPTTPSATRRSAVAFTLAERRRPGRAHRRRRRPRRPRRPSASASSSASPASTAPARRHAAAPASASPSPATSPSTTAAPSPSTRRPRRPLRPHPPRHPQLTPTAAVVVAVGDADTAREALQPAYRSRRRLVRGCGVRARGWRARLDVGEGLDPLLGLVGALEHPLALDHERGDGRDAVVVGLGPLGVHEVGLRVGRQQRGGTGRGRGRRRRRAPASTSWSATSSPSVK